MQKDELKPLLISTNTTIKQVMQKLNETSKKILFVVDESDKLIGTITDGDIRRGIIRGLGFNENIETVIHKNFTAVKSGLSNLEDYVKKLMVESEIEQIPVLNDEGIIIDVFFWNDFLDSKKTLEERRIYENQIVIMAGGKGTRLDPFTNILPKPLIPINNKPVIEHIMERFYKDGFYKFIYTLNYKKEYIKLFLREVNLPYKIDWIEEGTFLGTVGGIALLKEKITDSFFVVNCDSILDIDFDEVLRWHKRHKAAMTIIGCHNEVKIPFGVLELSNGKLNRILEKPVHDMIINTGAYVMEPQMLSYIPEGNYMDMNELINLVIEKEKISVYPISGGWFDIGQWEEYKKSVEKLGGLEIV